MSRTGLSPADIAENFRDRCGDGSVEWTYTPMQTGVLLDAADMLDENDQLVMKLNAEHLVRQNVERENAKLRELVAAMPYCMEARCLECPMCSPFDTSIGGVPECRASWKLSALEVEVDDGAR